MKNIGIWYFNYGWIITTILAIPLGIFAGSRKRPICWFIGILIPMLLLGVIMALFKISA